MSDPPIDTNVFIHAQTHDASAEECLRFLEAVRAGNVRTRIEPIVLHELSYALPHYRKGMTRLEIADYLLTILSWEGITGDKSLLVNTVECWRDTAGLAFVDAYLAALAARERCVVYTKNVVEFVRQGIGAPETLPH